MASKKSTVQDKDKSMKIMLVIALVIAFAGGYLVARAKYKPQILELNKMVADKDMTMEKMKSDANRVVMKDGAIWVIQNGVMSALDHEMSFTNGDKINSKGKITQKDRKEVLLQDGDSVDMDGNVSHNADKEMKAEGETGF
jgi:hypothetical protein